MIQTARRWKKLHVPVLCRAAPWLRYNSCTCVKAAPQTRDYKITPKKPTFKRSPTHTYLQFPAQSKGSTTGIVLSMFFPIDVQACKKCKHPLRLELRTAARGGLPTPSSSPVLQQCSPKPELPCYFTTFTNDATRSVISHKSSELCCASAMREATQSSPVKGHGLAPTPKAKVLPVLATFPQTLPEPPNSPENFNCCTEFCFPL